MTLGLVHLVEHIWSFVAPLESVTPASFLAGRPFRVLCTNEDALVSAREGIAWLRAELKRTEYAQEEAARGDAFEACFENGAKAHPICKT